MDFESLDICSIIDDELEEELVDRLEVGPGGVSQCFFLVHAHTFSWETLLLEDRQGAEDVFLDHVDNQVEVGDDHSRHTVLVVEVIIELLEVGLAIILLLHLFGVILEIEGIRAELELLQKLIPVSQNELLELSGDMFAVTALGGGCSRGASSVRPGGVAGFSSGLHDLK